MEINVTYYDRNKELNTILITINDSDIVNRVIKDDNYLWSRDMMDIYLQHDKNIDVVSEITYGYSGY